MTRRSRLRRVLATLGRIQLAVALATLMTVALTTAPSTAATSLTVAQAISDQDGSTATVRGYVVGQPTATDTVVTSGFPDDYALAIADSPSTTSTAQMLYVQIPSAFRAGWGLRSNPDLLGQQVDVTGTLTAYFSHPGHKNATAFALAGSAPGDPGGPGDPGDPGDGGDIPAGYYDSAEGKTGTALRDALHDIIKDQTTISYDAVWDALMVTDQDPNNNNDVIEVYSGRSVPKSTNGGDPDDWNREHTWAKSHGDFGTAAGPGTDLHHLMPEDVSVNSVRGNKDFDEGGSAVSQCSGCFSDADSFEPRDAVKGDIARAMFYMAIRYEGDDAFPDLELDDQVDNGSAPYIGRLSVLLQWNDEDPPSAFEERRNDLIYSDYQGNRNPFVDHPEWVDAIW